jgi:hypothetical protein
MTTLHRTHTGYFSLHIILRWQNSVFDNTYVDVIYLKVRINKGKVNSIQHYKVQNGSSKTAHHQAIIVFHDDLKTALSSGIQIAFCATLKHYGPFSDILQPRFFYNETGKCNCVFCAPPPPALCIIGAGFILSVNPPPPKIKFRFS